MIFHIAQKNDWTTAQTTGEYEAPSLVTEGFIHCSEQHQVLAVAQRLFCDRKDLVLLAINPQQLEAEVKYENCEGGVEQYPHIYGGIPLAAVQTVFPFAPDLNGTFTLPSEISS